MIGLVSFLQAAGIAIQTDSPKSLKIHLACSNGEEHPIDAFYAGTFKGWQEWQSKRNFECAQVLSLIDFREHGHHSWLFAGVYEILGCKASPRGINEFHYSTKVLPKQKELIGRLIVRHERSRASYIWHKPGVKLPLIEMFRKRRTIQEFPGYNAIVLSHGELKIIVEQKIPSWRAALSNVRGVYLITDTTTGLQYVGKASGTSGIWQRWHAYAKNGHGGNVELQWLLREEGAQHMTKFQYSILEIAETHTSDEDILKREQYWMKALQSREHGLNG